TAYRSRGVASGRGKIGPSPDAAARVFARRETRLSRPPGGTPWRFPPERGKLSALSPRAKFQQPLEQGPTMLRKAESLYNFELRARDGVIGKVKDFYFDDGYWAVRYLVVETGSWLDSRRVLIATSVIPD